MRHKVISCIMCLFFSFFRLSAADEFLTVDDAGQLLYTEYSDGETIKRDIVVFQKVICKNDGTNLWSALHTMGAAQFVMSNRNLESA